MVDAVDFLKNRVNAKYISAAAKQQRDILYFIQSDIQDDITSEYIKAWVDLKYSTSEPFLNWVKTVFKEQNFLSFFKYLRFPLSSAKLVNDDIKPQLARVFQAEDSYFNYQIRRKEIVPEELKSETFDNQIFESILFNHNGIIIHDLNEETKQHRQILTIDKVLSIESYSGVISRIGYNAELIINDKEECVFVYADAERYLVYDRDYNLLNEVPHDLGICPAEWITTENLSIKNDIVKKSMFSYLKNDLEEYVFLKTIQRMIEPNGGIPVTTKLKTTVNKPGGILQKNLPQEPMSSDTIGGQKSKAEQVGFSGSDLQFGTVIEIPANQDPTTGKIDMDVIKNYFQFHYVPVDSLEYLNKRIKEIYTNIITSVTGFYRESNGSAKNEMQVSAGLNNSEDILFDLSQQLTRIRKNSDAMLLGLIHGKDNVVVDVFFGSDFFLETQADLYKDFAAAPNAIERKSILIRIEQNRNKHNAHKAKRNTILYKLMPFVSDIDFDKAKEQIDPMTFQIQIRFSYWITLFESEFGDVCQFWDALESKESERILLITNLIKNIIKNEQAITTIGTPASVLGTSNV